MCKRGQFYIVAVLVIASIFIGLITITNFVKMKQNEPFFHIGDEIKIERQKILDYIFYNNLNNTQINTTFFNFSNIYLSEIGSKKNSVFIFGDDSSIYLNGNKIEGTEIVYNCGLSNVIIDTAGKFLKNCNPNTNNVTVYLDGQNYFFKIYEGQNFYYLINYIYGEERFIIYG